MISAHENMISSGHPSPQPPLNIAVYLADQNPHRDRSQGITSMTRTLIDRMATRQDVRITQIVSRSSYRQYQASIRTHELPLRTDRMWGRVIGDAIHPWMARPQVDLWYYPKGYVSRLAAPFNPAVGTMHDTIVQHYADHYPGSRSRRAFAYWIETTKRSLRRLSSVLTVSEHAAAQLHAFCLRYAIKPPSIEVTYESSAWEAMRGVSFEKEDCVIHLASSAPHKGTNRLLEHWRILQQRGRDLPRLDLIGNLDDDGEQICQSLSGVTRHPPQTAATLQTFVGKARVLLLPSEIEGFGLPALEAYYVGTPTCFVAQTSVAEVVRGEGREGAFALADVDSFAAALDWALSVPSASVLTIADAMHQDFSTERITDRVVTALRRAVAS